MVTVNIHNINAQHTKLVIKTTDTAKLDYKHTIYYKLLCCSEIAVFSSS